MNSIVTSLPLLLSEVGNIASVCSMQTKIYYSTCIFKISAIHSPLPLLTSSNQSPPLPSLPPTPTSRHPTPSPHPRTPPPHVPPHVTPGGRRNLETRSRQKGRGRVPQGVGDRSERGARRCTSSDSHNQIYLHLHHKYKYKYKCPKSIFVAAKKRKNWGRIGENHRLDSSHSHEKTWSGRDVWLQIRGDQQ